MRKQAYRSHDHIIVTLAEHAFTLMALSQDGFHQDPPHGSVSKEEVVEVLDDRGTKQTQKFSTAFVSDKHGSLSLSSSCPNMSKYVL